MESDYLEVIAKINGCTRRHSRLLSNINHTLKHGFSCHIDEAVLQTEHLLGITAEDSFLIATVGLLPNLHLTRDSVTDFPFHIIKVLNDPTLVDEPAKPVGTMAVREMKMIPDEIGAVGLALLGLSISVEVSDGQGVGVQSPQRNVFLFQEAVCGLFASYICSYCPPHLIGFIISRTSCAPTLKPLRNSLRLERLCRSMSAV